MPVDFDPMAASYDAQRRAFAPMKIGLHFALAAALADVGDGRVLCVGAGTGAELLALAEALPEARFTALDLSPKMLEQCRQRVDAAGLADRCDFHVGPVDSLPADAIYDAGTAILVSQFFREWSERVQFFADIAAHLQPGAVLVSADLARGPSASTYEAVAHTWFAAMHRVGMPARPEAFETHVGVVPPEDVEAMLEEAGFGSPARIYQWMLVHAWMSTRQPAQGGARREVRRGEIYWLQDPRPGSAAVRHPHVVVQDDVLNASRLDRVVLCALTSNPKRANEPGNVLLSEGEGGLPRQSVAVVSQVCSVDRRRLDGPIGRLSDERVEQILGGLRFLQRSGFSR